MLSLLRYFLLAGLVSGLLGCGDSSETASKTRSATPLESVEVSIQLGHSHVVNSVAFSPDGRLALSGSDDDTMKLWNVNSGHEIHTFSGHSGDVNAVAFSPDGRFALSGSKIIQLWELSSGRKIRTFSKHSDLIWSLAFSPDGRLALSGSRDGSMRLWEIATGKEIAQLASFEDGEWVTLLHTGEYVASANGDKYLNVLKKGTNQVSGITPYRTHFARSSIDLYSTRANTHHQPIQ